METVTTIAAARDRLDRARADGATVGLVPTMGYLHEGHASLIERAAAEHPFVAVTVFVNPLQFGPTEDLDAYPRDLAADQQLIERCGGTLVIAPSVEEMYPRPILTTVTVAEVSARLEGASRPTHFAGVATVVAKLFNLAGPCHAYFGEKDWQQVAVIRRMAQDLNFPVTVVACPIVREPDGLARSSRNVYLTEPERAAAPVLHRALEAGIAAIERGERDPAAIHRLMADLVGAEPHAALDYAEVVDAATLTPVDPLAGELRLLVAARFGRARLIDNVGVEVASGS
ncbi:MAG: pantoate--beta-alanine ligase [Acidimicrobiia bacterium]|nr:pantoate--beta-alanine ligase [Acidimicrobiia bacterium]